MRGADFFAVATIGEGVELREAGFTLPILVLGYVGDADAALLAEYDIAAALCDTDTAKAFSAAAQAAGKPIRVHIALNTGMTRIGFETRSTKENVQEILQAISLPGLEAEGAFTHFAVADVNGGEEFTELQYRRFVDMCLELEKHGVNLMYRHCSNSAAILQHTQTFTTDLYREGAFNMVRAGIILYGYYPDADTKKTVPLKPVMTVKARVAQVRDIPAGDYYWLRSHVHGGQADARGCIYHWLRGWLSARGKQSHFGCHTGQGRADHRTHLYGYGVGRCHGNGCETRR